MSILRIAVILTCALVLASCSASESEIPEEVGDCVEMLGKYPPKTILMESLGPVVVPYTSWSCQGYDSDTFADQLPVLMVAPNGEVTIEVEFRDEPVFKIRAQTESEQINLDGEIGEESLTLRLPDEAQQLWIRMCTSDGRCANYEARVEQ